MRLSRVLGLAIVLIVIWWIVTDPKSAAGSVESILDGLEGIAQNVTTFFTKVVT